MRSTLVYIKNKHQILMLYRNKKENDINHGKWIGVGGKCLPREKTKNCMKREVYEETNLIVQEYDYLGKLIFKYDNYQEDIHLYVVNKYSGNIKEDCNEGTLSFIDITKIYKLNLWDGDKYFLPYVIKNIKFNEMILEYRNDVLVRVTRDNEELFNIHNKMMEKVLKLAKKAAKNQEIPVAAIITKDNKVISQATNEKEKRKNALKHAEIIAIEKALKKINDKYLNDCILYVNLEPCLMCTGAIIQSRIKEIHYILDDNKAGFTSSNLNIENHKAIHHKIKVIKENKYKKEAKVIIKEFFKNKRKAV